MPLVCLGLSHHTAPVEVREHHAFPPARMAEALVALGDYETVREAAMLSTCNRLEIYAEVTAIDPGIAQLREFLLAFRHNGLQYDMEPYLYARSGYDAVEHCYRVATGLDSMLIGEAEILGQVKLAYHQAQRAQSLGPVLHRLFGGALSAGKAARSTTPIGGSSSSIATAAIAIARDFLGDLRGKSVVLVGAGKMGATAAKRLRIEGAGTLTIINRTRERAERLTEALGTGCAGEIGALPSALAAADVVITSTGAPHFVIHPEIVAETMAQRERPLVIIDIAVPRDVDPACTEIPGVRIVDIDELGARVDLTLEARRTAIPLVEEIIAEHLELFARWNESRVAFPAIARLSHKAEAIREGEIERLFTRCPDLSERHRALITGASLTILSKLLHSAIVHIRDKAADDPDAALSELALIEELFALGPPAGAGTQAEPATAQGSIG